MQQHSLRRRHHRLAFAWLLAAALLFAQTLGLAHQVLHAPGATPDAALFGDHDRADCQLFDHLTLGDALASALPLALPESPGVAPAVVLQTGVAHGCAAAYCARAPPRG